MTRILITAFEPYDRWPANSSWLALMDLTRWYDGDAEITTRRYPVDLSRMSENLRKDLQSNFDFAIHLGQSPGSTLIKLESVGLNVRGNGSPLISNAPEAYRSGLPLENCHRGLITAGIPSEISHHAGTYLCNAALYLSQHYSKSYGLRTKSLFLHIPLAPAQAAADKGSPPSMSTPMASAAVAMVIQHLQADAA
ncbi:MAG: pyroglutamyl-peptidase I [Rubripirellula sp.]|nr:pyrrolidone-carboxylate peptidase [Rhodopirellula sp.]MCH1438104.1 pyroglutamyl-peptidase I [Rubripirellula sp.]OUX08010.1 MAG: pyrrolidone-carboxylate peptidase [Planctomycetaceae bacterium TMED240]